MRYISMLLLLCLVSITAGCGADLTKVAQNHTEMMVSSFETKAQAKSTEVKEIDEKKVTNELIERIIQKTDENYRVEKFSSKEEISNHLQGVASEDLANEITDFYYEENDGGLYLKPTELFPWVDYENEYDLKKVNEFEYKLVQTNETDLYGTYTIEIEFEYSNNDWIIQNFTIQ
ncbi:hypothetical protein [Alkalihalobacillus sp. CinArs1]|uniref:hypothetical protein n=1 Tax=Alkalihalobacillus sp. CinArs1 TaxID=2995314 RepID=UPI0022DD64F5|nr:hypothetical protein [Alkalihalobacillus sp. CinArs1]